MRTQLLLASCAVLAILMLPLVAVASAVASVGIPEPESGPAPQHELLYMGPDVTSDTYAFGNCTYWVYLRRQQAGQPILTTWGNANTWAIRAKSDGYVVDHTPSVHAIMQTTAGEFGHVAFVEQVGPEGRWTVSEMNVMGWDEVDDRTFASASAADYLFIH